MTTTLNVWRLASDNPGHVSLQVDATTISHLTINRQACSLEAGVRPPSRL